MTPTSRPAASRSAHEVRVGFMPLVDAAPLIVAARLGFAEQEGLAIVLERETSWAAVRDRIAVAHLDVAHMLAPMPIAANLGLGPLPTRLVAPMALGTGGNTLTVSLGLWSELQAHGATPDLDAARSAQAFGAVVRRRAAMGVPKLTLAVVHPHSSHRYQIAYWLAVAGVDLGRDVDLVVVPPPLTAAALAGGQIDGFTAGEPWGSVAVASGVGAIVTTNAGIWRGSPEKVLGVRGRWADEDPGRLDALLRAVYRAAVWCDAPDHRAELARLLAGRDAVALPAEVIARSLSRQLLAPDGHLRPVDGLLSFAIGTATFPWISQALWFFAQMIRWQEAPATATALAAAAESFRPDLYRRALSPLGIALPAADRRIEGGPAATDLPQPTDAPATTFFDGGQFDPATIAAAIAPDPAP
jgi:NitT/TauT family transport system ATP-binding protein